MSRPARESASLGSLLAELGPALSACNPADSASTGEVLRRLEELRVRLAANGERDACLASLCGVAATLLSHLSRDGLVGPQETMATVQDVVGKVRNALGETPPAAAAAPAGPAAPAAAVPPTNPPERASLKLIDGRRLGEILVTLSMLSPAQVERALLAQRVTGKRLGETLVDMGLLSPDMVMGAIRIQRLRQDQWMDGWAGRRL